MLVRALLLAFSVFLPFSSFAGAAKVIAQIQPLQTKSSQQFDVVQDSKSQKYLVVFKDGKQKKQVEVSRSQAERIQNQVRSILWQTQNRRPAGTKKCAKYSKLAAEGDEAMVCLEDLRATGLSMGLLNSLSQYF